MIADLRRSAVVVRLLLALVFLPLLAPAALAASAAPAALQTLAATTAAPTKATTAAPPPPVTRAEVMRDTLHGVVIEDPYRWLEDKSSPETRAWITQQMAYTDRMLGKLPGRDALKARVAECLKVDQVAVPEERNGRYFFLKRRAGQDLFVLYTRKGPGGEDEVLVDPHPLSADHTVSISLQDVSSDGTLLAYGTRQGGEDEIAVTLIDVETRRELPDRLPKARYFGVSIKPDKSGLYYSRFTAQGSRVYYHAMGSDPAKDVLLFGEGHGPEKIISASLSEDGRWLFLAVYHGSAAEKVELYVQDVAAGGPIVTIVNDVDAYFEGSIAGDQLYLRTNWQAPNSRVLRVDLINPSRDRWQEIVPASDAELDQLSLAGGKLFLNYLQDVVSSVKVFDTAGRLERTIAFPTLGTVGSINGRWASPEAFFTFQSYHVPRTLYRYQVTSGERSEWWRAQVPIRSEDFELKQAWYTSKDGTRVPMFILHRKGLKVDGSHPTLLTGYGGFTVNETPTFSTQAVLWAEQGGVFAEPNLRGGAEFGEAWHKAGMLGKKQNVFDDFIAAGEWLIKNGYTRAEKLSIEGGSNGGLLVGAAMTQRPELFRAVVCDVPLLDMLRYHRFLVARFWVPEYGSSENAEQFKWLNAYSPYQHVTKGVEYPAVLFVTGDSDTRVDPLHARKMTALMQASTGSDRPVLLHYDTKLGHSGSGKPVSKQIEDTTDTLMFLAWQLGMETPAGVGAAGGKSAPGEK